MKTIGLLGGTSWPSTPLYYEYLNRAVADARGGHHSAEIILYSIDYHDIKLRYTAAGGWDDIPALLREKLQRLADMKPDCILVCNNTLHRALPEILPQMNLTVPVVDLVAETGRRLQQQGIGSALLLATRFTMEDGFFARRLQDEFNIKVNVPDAADRAEVQEIQTAVSAGKQEPAHAERLAAMVRARYNDSAAVILACTELPLVATQADYAMPLINTIHAQCDAALKRVL